MRVIDEKGKLFSKINIIDFLVVLFLLCLLPAFYFGYQVLTKIPLADAPEKEFFEAEIDSLFVKIKPELVKAISVGDKETNENGLVIGEILSLGQSTPYKYEFDIGENQKITKEDPLLKQIGAKLRLKAEVKQGKPYYKDKEIKIGLPLEFNTSKYILNAVPFEEEEEKEFFEAEIDSLFVKIKPELVKAISVGDKETNENGLVIGEILSLGQSTPYKYEFDIGENQKITKEDPLLKQIGAKLRLKAEVKQGKPYYKDKEIKIASPIEFKTSKYNLLIVPFEIKRERIIDLFVTLIDLGEGLLKEISVGDKELDKNGDTIVEILSLGKVENSYTAFDLGGAYDQLKRNAVKSTGVLSHCWHLSKC